MLGVAGWGFEGGKAGGKGDVQKGCGWEGEEGVVGLKEEVGEVGIAVWGVEALDGQAC